MLKVDVSRIYSVLGAGMDDEVGCDFGHCASKVGMGESEPCDVRFGITVTGGAGIKYD